MARYAAWLGRRVGIRYLEGEILLPATGVLAADSGRSIFLEERVGQPPQAARTFRWEIPYASIVDLFEGGVPEQVTGPSAFL